MTANFHGQATLTDHEMRRLSLGNQHTKWNVVKWQVVKAAAIECNVTDWTSKVDTSLTYEENVTLMKQHSTNPEHSPTVRNMPISVMEARPD